MKSILFVDDNDPFRSSFSRILRKEGYDVTEAGDGDDALRSLDQAVTDLMITDIIMPGKEGLETIHEVLSRFPQVKILAVSGGGRGSAMDYLKIAERMGAHGSIPKPFTREELLQKVREMIG